MMLNSYACSVGGGISHAARQADGEENSTSNIGGYLETRFAIRTSWRNRRHALSTPPSVKVRVDCAESLDGLLWELIGCSKRSEKM